MGVGLEELKEARFSPLFYAGKNYKKLYVFSNDKGTLLLKKKYFYFDHDTLPLKTANLFEELKPPSESYFIVRYSLSTLF